MLLVVLLIPGLNYVSDVCSRSRLFSLLCGKVKL